MGNNTPNREKILGNKRLQSIEVQVHTYLRGQTMTTKRIKDAFDGLASKKTIHQVVSNSPFFMIEGPDHQVTPLENQTHKATITYDFSYDGDEDNIELTIGTKEGKVGTGEEVTNAVLNGLDYKLRIKVSPTAMGLGNWKLDIKSIEVKDEGNKHKRILIGDNPIEKSGSWTQEFRTKIPL
ncbi:hypothetical protein [Aquimarina sp. LLG6339-5]|uniref:hypothetical protein n=1 Tax=Aquimarina sp. LLG6339-5 TaxID=3160830 RepID=UPI003870436D